MSIFRSHLFPHVAYLVGLTIVCIVGLSSLKQDVNDLKLQGDRLGPAIDLVAPPDTDTTLTDFGGPPLDVLDKRLRDCRDFYLSMISSRKPLYTMEGGVELLEEDVKVLRPYLQAVTSGVATIRPFVSAFLSPRYSANLRDLNRPIAENLLRSEGPDLFYAMEEVECDRKLEQLQGILIQVRHQALTEMKTATGQLGVKFGSSAGENAFDRLYRRILYTVIWLIVLSTAYLFAVNALLARPVKNLGEVARRVTSGRLLSRAKVSTGSSGPVAELSEDFNRMVDMLVKSLNEQQRSMATLKRRTTELQQANEHKNRFIANISHELKTPLNAVIGFADILMMAHHGEVSEKQMDYLSRIHGAGKHLLAMICDLIDVMKLDLNALQLKPESFDLVEKTRELEKMLMSQVDDKGHDFTCNLSEDMPDAFMDPVRYRQIVMNLLSNAIKFTPENGTIVLTLAYREVSNCYELEVKDSGIGISKRDQRRIFQDFIQLDSRLHRKHEGTGIGLALTRRLVDLMGGTLSVESTLGEGSEFTVVLPKTQPKLPEVGGQSQQKKVASKKSFLDSRKSS